MSADLITAREAPALVARRLRVREGVAADMLFQAGLRPFRQGMRHWYRRADIDVWLSRQDAWVETAVATCRACALRITMLGGSWTDSGGCTNCMSDLTADYAPHRPVTAAPEEER